MFCCGVLSFAIILMEMRESFLLYFFFLLSSDFYCSVILPHSAVGWSAKSK